MNTYRWVRLSSSLEGVEEASKSHFSVSDEAKIFGIPLNWDFILSRPSAMETGSWKTAAGV